MREADAAYWESHEIRERLVRDDPSDDERTYQLARSWNNFADYQTRRSSLGTALHFCHRSEQLRRDLHHAQPKNKEYVLELTGVLNRIGELEMLSFAGTAEAARLEQTGKLLAECERLLTELLRDSRGDQSLSVRAWARRGECRSLLARLPLLAAKVTSKEVEESRAAARAAGDDYAKLMDHRPKGKLTRDELYQKAAAQAIAIELYIKRGDTKASAAELYKTARFEMTTAYEGGFRRLAPQEVARDRAFQAVRDEKWFKALLDPPGPEAAKASGPPTRAETES
jgi:hypothetical protein